MNMKSIYTIILLVGALAVGYLLGRRSEQHVSADNHQQMQQGNAKPAVEPVAAVVPHWGLGQADKKADELPANAEAGKMPFTSSELAEMRFGFLRDVSVHYAGFIAGGGLAKDKAGLLLELLVDQRMIGIEASMQTSGGAARFGTKEEIAAAYEKNESLLADLLGADGVSALKRFDRASQQDEVSSKAIAAIEGVAPMAEGVRAAFSQGIQSFDPSGGAAAYIAPGIPITAAQEQAMRNEQQRKVDEILTKSSLDAAQQAAFRKWSEDEFNRSLQFVKQIIDANIKAKKP
ncbi:MAG: hypothetical protein BWX86_01605 [Verrucomicrobia bacterium ADurb.Bin122]|nr:MAG: hypothetical protein BWX86_01605 [Verrucomicrobia bacterium ADurb.Bin122]